VPGFADAWNKMAASWSTDRMGKRPPEPTDGLHVETHLMSGRDVFVSRDAPLIKMCERLRDGCGWSIDAVGIVEYVSRYGLTKSATSS
jgi:hypothetical protein